MRGSREEESTGRRDAALEAVEQPVDVVHGEKAFELFRKPEETAIARLHRRPFPPAINLLLPEASEEQKLREARGIDFAEAGRFRERAIRKMEGNRGFRRGPFLLRHFLGRDGFSAWSAASDCNLGRAWAQSTKWAGHVGVTTATSPGRDGRRRRAEPLIFIPSREMKDPSTRGLCGPLNTSTRDKMRHAIYTDSETCLIKSRLIGTKPISKIPHGNQIEG